MRRVFKGGAVVALIAILIAPAIYADDPPSPFDAPSVRISPPSGIAAQDDSPQARIGPPGGIAAQEEPSFFELLLTWLEVRIGPPTG
jgi:hypothetical protein